MTTISKKEATKKSGRKNGTSAASSRLGQASKKKTKGGETTAARSVRSDMTVHTVRGEGNADRSIRRDAKAGQLVDKANEHMERAWGKIYAHRNKDGKAA